MSIIVQKFGGTSVADSDKIMQAARKAIRAQQQGHQVVMVVSAMGKNTDMLVDLAGQITQAPPAREMDMLLSTGEQVSVALMAMAIHELGGHATSLTGGQIGIKTDSSHTKARIQSISTDRMQQLLDDGRIVIAAGFQGTDDQGNITTLGRGGSDTTAVALAAVLRAEACQIYTDVDGVFTTDPRIVAEARKLNQVSHDEMLELASLGAGVMHSRSIEFGKKFGVPIHVCNSESFSDEPGTVIGAVPESADRPVSGCALTKSEARISIVGVPDRPGTMATIFEHLANVHVAVDMIVQNIAEGGKAEIAFTVLQSDLAAVLPAVEQAAEELGAAEVNHEENLSKVSVVGLGMATQSGVADRMFRALGDDGVNIHAITTSQIKISTLVDQAQGLPALRAVHSEFELDKSPSLRQAYEDSATTSVPGSAPLNAVDVVARLQSMEDLAIDDVQLDDTQGRVTIFQIPDEPGFAAQVFEAVAAKQLLVDMIVQGAATDGAATLSFTVPRDHVQDARRVVEEEVARYNCPVAADADIAILSVLGIGIRTHVGVGNLLFQTLRDKQINVEMINTSEVRINVVVEVSQGDTGLDALRHAFREAMNR